MKTTIAVIGDGKIDKGGDKYRLAFELGRALVDNGYRVQSGGMRGVMEAVFEGAKASEAHTDGDIIAILPGFSHSGGNGLADIVLPTGLDIYRNVIVASASAVVAIGGGAGTLSEMAYAWTTHRLVIGYDNVIGWSAMLAGKKIDGKDRGAPLCDMVYPVQCAADVLRVLTEMLPLYKTDFAGIR